MSVHLLLLTVSCCALAAAVAGAPLTERGTKSLQAGRLALLVSGALVLGNAVCLLPGTPAWYSAGLIALTFSGLVWLAVAMIVAARPIAPPRHPVAVSEDRPHLTVVGSGRIPPNGSGPAAQGVVWDAQLLDAYLSQRSRVTRADLDTIGSRGARAQSVEVARRIDRYTEQATTRRTAVRQHLQTAYTDPPVPPRSRGGRA